MHSRRDFMKSLGIGGAALYASAPLRGSQSSVAADRIENQFLVAQFDTASGQIQVDRKNGDLLLRNAVARAALASHVHATSDREYERSSSIRQVQDALGKGRQISARCRDRRRLVDFDVLLTLYDGRNALVVEVICRNSSRTAMTLSRIEPVRAVLEEGAGAGGTERARRSRTGTCTPTRAMLRSSAARTGMPSLACGTWVSIAGSVKKR
jgi:hypothetical protein